MKVLPFRPQPPKKIPEEMESKGRILYDMYRKERGRQGWAEFEWEKLSPVQQLVWARVTDRLQVMGITSLQ